MGKLRYLLLSFFGLPGYIANAFLLHGFVFGQVNNVWLDGVHVGVEEHGYESDDAVILQRLYG